MMISPSERAQIVSKVQQTVQKCFYAPDFHGKDWNRIVASHKQAILAAPSTESFERKVNEMVTELDSRMGLLGPDSKITSRNSINASFRGVEIPAFGGKRWVFQDVAPGGIAQRAGVQSGDILVSVSGTSAAPPAQPAFAMGQVIPIETLRGNESRKHDLDLKTPAPKYEDNPYSEPSSVEGTLTPDGVAVVKVSLFPGKIGIDFANSLSRLFKGKLALADRLLLDLRGNPGGGIGGLRLMSLLTPYKCPVGYSLDRVTAERGTPKEHLPRLSKIPSQKWEIALMAIQFGTKKSVVLETEGLGPKRFHDRVVVLVNEHTTGAAEMVAQFAKENQLAKIVGIKTPGRLISRTGAKVGSGYRLVFPVASYQSWQGHKLEGKGIEPDVAVDWSCEDAQRGIDSQLDTALEALRAM
jgi:C-terminal processing protease CtpA/Prc